MKTIEIKNATAALAQYAKGIDREAVLIVQKGKPLAVLSSAKGMDAESIALANNPKFAAIIRRSRARHEAEGGFTIDDVRRQLELPTRKKRRKAG
jgi:PHD/YefM family antitoxin component YafN of YafNO toxin-antitoxin module